jgi:hypothetical protein
VRVLVIPEDFVKDQFVLLPLIEAMMRALGNPRADVRICHNPRLRGFADALRWERIADILARYPTIDLLLLCIDRDGDANRRTALDNLEKRAASVLKAGRALLAEHAWQEVEVWVLAGHDLPSRWSWAAVRQEPNPKERYFQPYAALRGLDKEPDGGRTRLAQEAARRYDRIRQLCSEDIGALEERVRAWMGAVV